MAIAECVFDLGQHDLLIVGAALMPREREHPVEIRAQHLILAGRGREHTQAFGFAARLAGHLVRKLCFVDATQQIDRFLFVRIGLAQFGLNRPQLLPEIELALMLLDLDFGLLLHVFHHAGAGDFALEA